MTKQIKIEELIPFMKEGWVAMDKNGLWFWFYRKPEIIIEAWNYPNGIGIYECLSNAFNIAPAKEWAKSLIKIGGK